MGALLDCERYEAEYAIFKGMKDSLLKATEIFVSSINHFEEGTGCYLGEMIDDFESKSTAALSNYGRRN